MTCPYCQHQFPMTWKRYAHAPRGQHTCPACQRQSRFHWSLPYFACLLAGNLVLGALCQIYFDYTTGLFVLITIGLFVGIPIDKFHDGRFRKLHPIEQPSPQPSRSAVEYAEPMQRDNRLREVGILALVGVLILAAIFVARFIALNIPPLF